jgi:cell division protein FtsQ
MKKWLHRIVWILITTAAIYLLIWSNNQRMSHYTKEIIISISEKGSAALIPAETIETRVLKDVPSVIGATEKNIDISRIENVVAQNTQLAGVKAYLDFGGNLFIEARARDAVLRIFNKNGSHMYLGEDVILMENSLSQSYRILVANGNIPHLDENQRKLIFEKKEELPDIYFKLYALAQLIESDDFLKKLISQIYVDKNEKIILTPIIGVKKIEFGKMENMKQKLSNLKAFYLKGDKINWQAYKSINIEFENQIVCSKK